MRNLRVLFICLMASSNCLAITNQDIHGVILDKAKNPIAYANVVVMTSDSTFVNGCTSDDKGMYILPNIPNEGKFMKVSAIGYDTRVIDIPQQAFPIPWYWNPKDTKTKKIPQASAFRMTLTI